MISTERTWIVLNPLTIGARPPTYLHPSFESAETEAERLAKQFPGEVFHVMASVVAKVKHEVRSINFSDDATEESRDVPF